MCRTVKGYDRLRSVSNTSRTMKGSRFMIYVGVDVAKLKFDVCFDAHQKQQAKQKKKFATFANTDEGMQEFCAQLPEEAFVIFESTGRYSKLLYKTLCTKGIPCCCVNPYRVLQFSRAMGRNAKTDKTDAETQTLYGEKIQPERTYFMSEQNEELRELVRAREVFVEDLRRYKNRVEVPYISKAVNKMYADTIDHLEKQIKTVNQQINEFMVRNPEHAEKQRRLVTIKGIGAVTATSLLAHFSEIGTFSRQELGAISGTAPHTKQSGTTYMKEHIQGGRPELRRSLYMSAQIARRHDPEMHALYERHISKGKPPKVAITAVMRKLLIRANSILKRRVDYEVRGTPPFKDNQPKKAA